MRAILLSEKTLRDSILNLQTEENKNNVFMQPVNINRVKQKNAFNMSESSVYYDHAKNTNVIEEYSNVNKLDTLNEDDSPKINNLFGGNNKNQLFGDNNKNQLVGENNAKSGNPVKYFSNLNV